MSTEWSSIDTGGHVVAQIPKDLLVRGRVVREMCACNWLVKAVVFPVVMYKSESWTIKKA